MREVPFTRLLQLLAQKFRKEVETIMKLLFLWWIAQWPAPLTTFHIQLCQERVARVKQSIVRQAPKRLKLLA